MKKLFIISIVLVFSLTTVKAQDFPLHTQYMYNKATVNPGFVGVKGKMSLLLMHRSQWINLDGAPTTSDFAFELPFEKTAFGLGVNYDQLGPITHITGNFQFSYNLELSYTTFLSLGLNTGVYQRKFDIDKLKILDVDEDLFSQSQDVLDFNVGVGAFLYSESWYLGLSVPNVNMHNYYKNLTTQLDKRLLHVYFMSGYNFELNRDMTLQPSFLVRYVDKLPLSADISLNLQWNETLTTGLAYRLNSAYSLLIGVNVSRMLHVGYAFDWDQSKFYKTNYGSHEVFIRYYLQTDENSLRYQSPRFF
jgi:type IX secretion system PorP/SprF family membrane protein